MPYSVKAAFNASGKDEDLCLPNTRVDILNQIRAWIDGFDRTNVFWLSGWAGTGKSIIARTISREYYDKGRQGENFFASFFFSRGEEDVSDAGKFATSIAVQLAKFPVLEEWIHKAASDDDRIANKILHDQWKQLVVEPMSKLETKLVRKSLVLVIDALDECDKQGDIRRVLQLLANVGALQTVRLRVLITSRPEIDIRNGFSRILQGVYQESILHDISKSVVDNDILVFLNDKFERTLPTDWPGDQAIKHLVQKAAGLFIWAAIAYRFIHDGRQFADRRLGLILQGSASITKPEDELSKIYITVLKTSVGHGYDDEEKETLYELLRESLGSIVLLFSPLSIDSLASLINRPGKDLRQTLDHLHSILEAPERQSCPIRLHHPSFRDFFLDTKRCTDRKLQVNRYKAHWALANSCIRIMSSKLKKDICNLYLPGALASEVDDNQKEQYIPSELQYACSYWVQHLQESKGLLLDNGEVHLFLRKNLLFWLEALSLLRKVNEGVIALISLENLVKVSGIKDSIHGKMFLLTLTKADQSPSLYALIHDAKRFSLNFRWIIEQAPLQIYSSALLFAPEMCLVRKEFQVQMPKWITSVIRRQKYWSSALQALEGHSDAVNAVVFSPDGKLISSASDDATIRLWDSSTGTMLQTLTGHLSGVNAVDFSPDGKLIASGSWDNTIRLWDSSTGAALHILKGHANFVRAVVFSPDGKLLASASWDRTVRLWDSYTGATLQILEGHSDWIKAVVFSPEGKLIASASDDQTIKLWDSSTGAALQTLEGHSDGIIAVAFSPDGKLIASASDDHTIRLWDSSTGAALQILKGHSNFVQAVVFSPDGKLLASASWDRTVRLWDSYTGATLQILEGHSDWIKAVVFSPEGKLIASASDDQTIKLWDSSTGAALQTLEGHSDGIIALVFSPDGKLIASASKDNTIRLWDPSAGATLEALKGHSNMLGAVRFSPDGKLIESASDDVTIKLWESSCVTALQTPEGHSRSVNAVMLSPNGKLIASASLDKTIRLWDSNTGAALQTLKGHSSWVRAVIFSPDGKLIASGSTDATVRLWDSSSGAALQTLKGHIDEVIAVAFSPDGKLIASASDDHTIRLWDSNTGVALQILLRHSDWIWTVLFSPNGKLIVFALSHKIVCLWDLSTRSVIQKVKMPLGVNTLSFSQDGSSLETNKGFLCFLPRFYKPCFPHLPAKLSISLQDRWIVGKPMGNLLWLPPGYQASCSHVRKNSIVLGHESGYISCIHFQ